MNKLQNPEISLGDLLATLDSSILYLLERRYLDNWSKDHNQFVPRNSRLDWTSGFGGFRLDGLRYYGKSETALALKNMEMFLGMFRGGSHSFICCMDGRNQRVPEISLLSAPRSVDSPRTDNYEAILERGIRANFPGSILTPVDMKSYLVFANTLKDYPYVGAMTGIPSRKRSEDAFFSQGIERFLDSVAGTDFACLIVAEPYTVAEMVPLIDPVLRLKNEIGQFRKFTLSDTSSITDSVGNTMTIGAMLNRTLSESDSKTYLGPGGATLAAAGATSAAGAKAGAWIGGAIGSAFAGVGAAPGAVIGSAIGAAAGPIMLAAGVAAGELALTHTLTETISNTLGGFSSYSRTKTQAKTKSTAVGREAVNYSAEYALEILDSQIERLRAARSSGYWKVGFYCFSKDIHTHTCVKNAASTVFSGANSAFEPIRFVDILTGESDKTKQGSEIAITEILAGYNPKVKYLQEIQRSISDSQERDFEKRKIPLHECMDGLSTPMTTEELAIMVAPPQRECRALSVTERGVMGGKTLIGDQMQSQSNEGLNLGNLLYYGQPTQEQVYLPIRELARHAFVTGITGSGKTNTLRGWCCELSKEGIPWLVIEPGAKKEYRHLVADSRIECDVFSLGTEGLTAHETSIGIGAPFRLNPFYFPQGISIMTHIDGIKAAFSAAFPMYASMPYLMEEAIYEIYRDNGWDLVHSTNRHAANPWEKGISELVFPTMRDLRDKIDSVVENKGYDIRLQMDLSASLRTRIGSLLIGGKGTMLNTPYSLDLAKLRKRNVVIEMAAIGSDDEKCFIMAMLLLAMQEHAILDSDREDQQLRHVLIIEEAHRLFRNTASADNPEIANIRGAAVEQFSNALAELRAMGQGIVVIDQIPSKLIPDVIKNTALKVVHQMGSADDRKLVGETMTLEPSQQMELARLHIGEAVTYHQSWEKAYLIKAPLHKEYHASKDQLNSNRNRVISSYEETYGPKGARIGVSLETMTSSVFLNATKGLFAVTLMDADLLRKAANALRTGFQSSLELAIQTNQQSGQKSQEHEACMVSLIRDLLRDQSAKANLLSECPERFVNLLTEALTGKDISEHLKRMQTTLLDAIDAANPIEVLESAVARLTVRGLNLGAIPERIGLKNGNPDASFLEMRKEILSIVTQLVGDRFQDAIGKHMERLLTEQVIEQSILQRKHEIVEEYNRRFL